MSLTTPRYSDRPDEKGKPLDPKTKLLVNTVREVVLAILDGKNEVKLKRYTKSINWIDPQKKPRKKEEFTFDISPEYTPVPRDKTRILHTKDTVHSALEAVGIDKSNTRNRIRTAIESLESQYKDITKENFFHRMENGKLVRDAKFLLGVPFLLASEGKKARKSTLKSLKGEGNYQGLNKPANKALKTILVTAKKYLGSTPTGNKLYKTLVSNLKLSIEKFEHKELTSEETSVSS